MKGTPGIIEATREAMLQLAKLCEGMATEDGVFEARAGEMGGKGRENLAALSVKQYLRAMAVG